MGIAPRLSDAELVTLAVIQVPLRYDSEARFGRHAHAHLGPRFPYLPTRSAYNKRMRRSVGLIQHVISWLARDSPSWWDDVWLVDSTPVECGRRRQTQQRSDLGGWANMRLLRVRFPLLLGTAPPSCGHTVGVADHVRSRRCQSRRTRHLLTSAVPRPDSTRRPDYHGLQRLSQRRLRERPRSWRDQTHPTRHQIDPPRVGIPFLKALRKTIESVYDTLKDQLGLQHHGGRTRTGVWVRVLQRILAPTVIIWHNQTTQRPGPAGSLIAYDHQNPGTDHLEQQKVPLRGFGPSGE